MPELSEMLRRSCQICLVDNAPDLKMTAEYLSAHKPGYTLGDWQKGDTDLPVLYYLEERMYFAKP
jgi:hypothetical protein